MWKGRPATGSTSVPVLTDSSGQGDRGAGACRYSVGERLPRTECPPAPKGTVTGMQEKQEWGGVLSCRGHEGATRGVPGRPAGEMGEGTRATPRGLEGDLRGQTYRYPGKLRQGSATFMCSVQAIPFGACVGSAEQVSTWGTVPLTFFYPSI